MLTVKHNGYTVVKQPNKITVEGNLVRYLDFVKAGYIPLPFHLCCPSQTLLHWLTFFPAGLMLDGPLDRGTGNKYGPMASACYAKEHVHIDAFGILSPIDLPSALHIYTF